jgi:integrase
MPKDLGFQVNFKNEHKASFLAKEIASYFYKGTALEQRIETVLNDLRTEVGIKSLKKLDQEVIRTYVDHLKNRVESGDLSRKTAENYISALNRIVEYVNARLDKDLQTISPKAEGLSRGPFEYVNRAVSQEVFSKFQDFLSQKGTVQAEFLKISTRLGWECGMRLRETFAIKYDTIKSALETGVLRLGREDGTKNGREREIPILKESQREALEQAKDLMERYGLSSLVPTETLREQYNFAQNIAKEFKELTGEKFSYHGLRHAFAQQAIAEGFDRATVSSWLGHGREEITKVYVK